MKSGDKIRNKESGNEGTVLQLLSDGVIQMTYNSPAYGPGAFGQTHDVASDRFVVIPNFQQFASGSTHIYHATHPVFSPGTRANHDNWGAGTVTGAYELSSDPAYGTVLFVPDSEVGMEFRAYVSMLTPLEAPLVLDEPSPFTQADIDIAYMKGYEDGQGDAEAEVERAENSGWNQCHDQIDKEQQQITARTNQLINELYHDRARLEKEIAMLKDTMRNASRILNSGVEVVSGSASQTQLAVIVAGLYQAAK